MNTQQLLDSICAVNERLVAALGDWVPAWNAGVQDYAEHAILGDVYRGQDGQWTRIDFEAVDWNATRTVNPGTIIMVLRRFAVFGPLAAGYRATGDERYAQAAARYLSAFLRDHPPVDGWTPVPGDGDTEYDNRVGVWLQALNVFRRSPAFTEQLVELVLRSVTVYMRYLMEHIFPDRNIRFLHGEVLLVTGLRFTGVPEAAAWLQQGREIVNDAMRRQILPDGAHMEATPHYHNCVIDMVLDAWHIARAFPEASLQVPTERVAAMFDYQLASSRPDGAEISLHDGRYMPALMKPNTALYDGRKAFRREAGLPAQDPPCCTWFRDAMQLFRRDDWTPASSYLTFDAAPRRSYHWHPSRNSITLYAHGRALLVDPGYTFETPDWPRYGHKTAHHSTVNFNGWDQSECQAELRVASAPGYTLAAGCYGGGYWPLEKYSHGSGVFGEHHRVLLWLHGRFGVVLDHIHHTCIEGQKPTVESCWQLSEGPAVCDPAARRVVTRHEHGNLLLLFPLVLAGTQFSLHEGEREPVMRGWLPADWGRACIPAPLVRAVAPAYDPWNGDMATVLLPFADATPPQVACEATGPELLRDSRRAGCLRLRAADGTSDVVVWTQRLRHAVGHQHGLNTDASLVHLRLDAAGTVTGGLLVDGSFCECTGPGMTLPKGLVLATASLATG